MPKDEVRTLLRWHYPELLLAALVLGAACATQPGALEPRVRASLDVLLEVVDPAYRWATDDCLLREREASARAVAGEQGAREQYVRIKERCHDVRDAFRELRKAHGRAADLVEAGAIEDAERELERVRTLWRALRAGEDGGVP